MPAFKINSSLPHVAVIREYATKVTHPLGFFFLAKALVLFSYAYKANLFQTIDGKFFPLDALEEDNDSAIEQLTTQLFSGVRGFNMKSFRESMLSSCFEDGGVDSCYLLMKEIAKINRTKKTQATMFGGNNKTTEAVIALQNFFGMVLWELIEGPIETD